MDNEALQIKSNSESFGWEQKNLFEQNEGPQNCSSMLSVSGGEPAITKKEIIAEIVAESGLNYDNEFLNTKSNALPGENADLHLIKNVETHSSENNVVSQNLSDRKPQSSRGEKLESSDASNFQKGTSRSIKKRTKKPKKNFSKKRKVIPLKFFVTPEEKIDLEERVAASGSSLSNYVRLRIDFAPNEKGRKKQNIKPAFDLDDLDLD